MRDNLSRNGIKNHDSWWVILTMLIIFGTNITKQNTKIMKQVISIVGAKVSMIICFSLFVILLSDCSKSSDPQISLDGTWIVTNESESHCNNSIDNSNSTISCSLTNCAKFTFASNTITINLIINNASNSTQGTYSVSGNSITFTVNGKTETDTFTVVGNTLVITSPKKASTGCVATVTLVRA